MRNTIFQITFPFFLITVHVIKFFQIGLRRNFNNGCFKVFVYSFMSFPHQKMPVTVFSLAFFNNHPTDGCMLKIISGIKQPGISNDTIILRADKMQGFFILAVNILIDTILLYDKNFATQLQDLIEFLCSEFRKCFSFKRNHTLNLFCLFRIHLLSALSKCQAVNSAPSIFIKPNGKRSYFSKKGVFFFGKKFKLSLSGSLCKKLIFYRSNHDIKTGLQLIASIIGL